MTDENQMNNEVTDQQNDGQSVKDESMVEIPLEISSHEEPADIDVEQPENFSNLSKEEFVKIMESFLTEQDYSLIKSKINPLKEAFNEIISQEKQQQLEKYLEAGGERDDFKYKADEEEIKFNAAYRKVNKRRIEFHEGQEKHREENLNAKQEILKQLKDIIQNEENMAKAFTVFHELQSKWRAIGPVPPKNVNDLWMTYKLYIEKFYDLIKINRELQELDQKKNLEMKINLCEQAEELYLEPSINKALTRLHTLQNNWREVGHIPREKRVEIGERFKAASDKVFERKKEYLENLKVKQEENLKVKVVLCEKVEAVQTGENITHHELQEKLKIILALQNDWRKTGSAEKKADEEVWKRFKTTCDIFFRQKQEFYQHKKKEYAANLQAKTELCMQAEALMNNTDWKHSSAELRRLNEEWKKTGPVAAKVSDKIWYRFRTACDAFFQNRKNHFSEIDKQYEDNYNNKILLLERIEQYKPGQNQEENFNSIKNFQREWNEIGMVPIGKKEQVQTSYKKLIDDLFNGLKLTDQEKNQIRYKDKLDTFKNAPHSKEKISDEKKNLMHKLSQLKNDVTVWENNLGFFAKSKNAEGIKQEFEEKILKAKEEISRLKDQLQMIKTF
jgi:hypothetical protein